MDRIKHIVPVDRKYADLAQARWDSVAKPLRSFGLLEDMWNRIAAVQRTDTPNIFNRAVVVMCADNGVVAEGVTQSDNTVTSVCAREIASGRSNINVLADVYRAEVVAVDIGIARDIQCKGLLNRKVAFGSNNIAAGPAMTVAQAEEAIRTGMDIVRDLSNKGMKIIVTGEMGIGNTTPTAALSSVLLGLPPDVVTGRGAGLSTEGLERKIAVVKRAIKVNAPYTGNAVELLSKLGSYEIAGMIGLYLGGAVYGVTIVIDGVISAVAAAVAAMIAPDSVDYMLAGHVSAEPAGRGLIGKLGLHAVIDGGLKLGEGTGGILLLPLLDGAAAIYYNSHRFDASGIERYVELK
jgi:nicotinate-nucleotide--dimethylbenzimidazole phosphoribosyltransferase